MRNELRHTLELGVGTGLSSLFRIAFVVIAGRALGPAEYADFYAALSIASLVAAATASVAGTITRFVSLYEAQGQPQKISELRARLPRYVAAGAVVLGLLGLAGTRPMIHYLHFQSPITPLLLAAIIPLNLLIDAPRGFLRGLQRFRSYGVSLASESILRLVICLVAFQVIARSAPAGIAAQALATLIILGVTHGLLRRASDPVAAPSEPEIDLRDLARFTLPLFGFAVLVALFQNADALLVKAVFGAVEAGQFGAVNAVSKLVWLVFLPFGILSLPLLTSEHSSGRSIWPPLARTIAGFLILSVAILVVFRFLGPMLLETLFGAEYAPGAPLLIPLTVGVALSATAVLIGQAFAAMNRFVFLYLYSFGLSIQLLWMYRARNSMLEVVHAIVGSQLAIVVAMLILLFAISRKPSSPGASEVVAR